MRRFIHGVLAPNARPKPSRIIKTKKKTKEKTLPDCLPKLLALDRKPDICITRRLGGIGDVIMTTTMLRHIKKLVPDCNLAYATNLDYADGALGDILKYNPYIDELIDFRSIKERKFDYDADVTVTGLRKEMPGTVPPNRIDMFAERIGIDVTDDPLPDYIVSKEETKWAKEKLRELSEKGTKFVAIHARSNDARRTWPLQSVGKLIKLLNETENVHPIIFDWADDFKWDEKICTVFLGLNIRLAMALINECECLVCPDSGLLHLAGALEKKIVTIFGTTAPESRINHYKNATAVISDNCAARPCWYSPKCLKEANKLQCYADISPETVYNATMTKIKSTSNISQIINEKLKAEKPRKAILVRRRHGGFGDIMMTLTGLEAMSAQYPLTEIHYALPEKYIPAAENVPFLKGLIDINSKIDNNRYKDGAIIDISSPCAYYESTRVKHKKSVEKSRVEIFAEALGSRRKLTDLKPRYYPRDEEVKWAKTFLNKFSNREKPLVGLALNTAEEYRNWPKEKYYQLRKRFGDKVDIAIFSDSRDHNFDDVIDACALPFRKSMAVGSLCDLIITPDTSFLHLAGALDIPAVVLFGPIEAGARCKGYKNIVIIRANMNCIPCWRSSHSPCNATNLIAGYSKCMENIPTNMVYDAATKTLEAIK
jgi:ADP-heptose:LPS heptosyltransferase